MRIVDVPVEWQRWLRVVAEVSADDMDRHLTAEERADVERLRVPERRLERAASRIAGKILLADTLRINDPHAIEFRKEDERPFARVRGSMTSVAVSFTHSHGLGAAATGETPVGVDLERIRDIRAEMTRFFMSNDELAAAEQLDTPHRLLHFWSAKEAAFKMGATWPTLLKVPLRVSGIVSSGLTFEIEGTSSLVETRMIGTDFLLALARAR